MMETLGFSINSETTLKLLQDDSGRTSILGTPIYTLGGDSIQLKDNIFTLTLKIFKTLSSTSYTG